MYEIPLAS